GASYAEIEVVIHREQIIHSMVEWKDRTTIAQLSFPDMKLPIQYALTWPRRLEGLGAPLDFSRMRSMTFEEVEQGQFPAFELALYAGKSGRSYPTVLSAADEIAVAAFLAGKIRFIDIPPVIESALAAHNAIPVTELAAIAEADEWARRHTHDVI